MRRRVCSPLFRRGEVAQGARFSPDKTAKSGGKSARQIFDFRNLPVGSQLGGWKNVGTVQAASVVMKTPLSYLGVLGAACLLAPLSYAADNTATPPIPGTVQSTDTKTSSAQNNTPRVNPTPNPDPGSQPADSTTVKVYKVQN